MTGSQTKKQTMPARPLPFKPSLDRLTFYNGKLVYSIFISNYWLPRTNTCYLENFLLMESNFFLKHHHTNNS